MAIAFDSKVGFDSATNPSSPATFTFNNVAGTYMFVTILDYTNQTVTGVTYNGVGMTELGTTTTQSNFSGIYLFGLANPATGSNTVSISFTGSPLLILACASSYSGANSVGTAVTNRVTATSITTTVTTVADNSWTILGCGSDSHATTAGTGSFLRQQDATYQAITLYDSNAAITPAGSYSMVVNDAISDFLATVMVELKQTVVSSTGNMFLLM